MDAPVSFKSALDYQEWWFFSGTALGGQSPGETFKQLHAALSEAGANTVIAARFLDDNEGTIDLERWRRAAAYGHVGLHVSLTLRALEAIGAARLAQAIRSLPGRPSLLSRAEEIVQTGHSNPEETARLISEARESLGMSAPRPTVGVEAHDEVRRLLDAYVAAHQNELARDVAKYGDPRKHPEFDPGHAREQRAAKIRRLASLRHQRTVIDDLRDWLDKLKALVAKEPPESPRLNKVVRKVLDDYAGFAAYEPEERTPAIEAWLRDVEQLREAHPDAFAPKASRDERINARLVAIGPHEVSYEFNTLSIRWDKPAGLDCEWTDLQLGLDLSLEKKVDPSRVNAGLDAICDEWARLRERWPGLRAELKDYILELFRRLVADNLDDDVRAAYEVEGVLSDEKILDAIERGAILLSRQANHPVGMSAIFRVAWDEDHPLEVQFRQPGEIVRWFDEFPSFPVPPTEP